MMRQIATAIFPVLALSLLAPAAHSQPVVTPDRPLVFIPGILGSEIWINGHLAWSGAGSLSNLDQLRISDGPKDGEAAPTCGPDENTEICGLLEEFSILGPIKADQYSGVIQRLTSLGYSRTGGSRNLFVFTYDWRQSNFQTATALKAFVDSTPGLVGQDFDVLAHSMGGLVALIYAKRFDAPDAGKDCTTPGRCRIKTLITAGTPYFGSMNAVAIPLEGWGWISRRLTGGAETIARTVLSWPSFYELLPTYDGCCGDDPAATMANYESFRQLPYATGNAAPVHKAIEDALQRRRDLDALAREGWPEYIGEKSAQCSDGKRRTNLYLIAGDHNDTKRRVMLAGGAPEYDQRRGDGTVLLRSASLNQPNEAWLSFVEHRKILDDTNVQAKLEHILLRCHVDTVDFAAPTPVVSLDKVAGAPIEAPLETASAHIIQHGGDPEPLTFSVEASVAVSILADVIPPAATLRATLDGTEILHSNLGLIEARDESTNRRFVYGKQDIALPHPGLVEVEVTFAGGVTVSDQAFSF